MTFAEEFVEVLRRHHSERAQDLIHGSPTTLESYKQRVGYLAGIRAAEDLFVEFVKKRAKNKEE